MLALKVAASVGDVRIKGNPLKLWCSREAILCYGKKVVIVNWRAIDSIHKDQAQVATTILCEEQGQPSKCTCNHTVQPQNRLHTVCTDFCDGLNSASVSSKVLDYVEIVVVGLVQKIKTRAGIHKRS